MRLRRLGGAAAAALVALVGCGSTKPKVSTASSVTAPAGPAITVLAATSLTEVFNRLAVQFTAERHVPVRLAFGPSSGLVRQVGEDPSVDVLVTADDVTMGKAVQAGDVAAPRPFAGNELEIAVAPGNPKHVRGAGDLGRSDLVVVACAREVPCGRLAQEAFGRAHVTVSVKSFEPDVAATLTKVRTGEADAGLVYVTSVLGAKAAVIGVPLGGGITERAPDVVAVATRAPHRAGAEDFVAFLLSAPAQQALRDAGFAAP